jgi:hypothetical protein
LLADGRLFSVDAFREAISRYQSAQVSAVNVEAVRKGAQLCQVV